MQTSGRTTAIAICAILAIVTSWVWLPRIVATVLGDWTRPWFSIVWLAVSIVAIVVMVVANRQAFFTWIREPFRR